MKTKTFTLRVALLTLSVVVFAISTSAQMSDSDQAASIHRKSPQKIAHKAPDHHNLLAGKYDFDRTKSGENFLDASYHADTIFRFSITNGNSKIFNSYDDQGKLLSKLERIWMINDWVNSRITLYAYDSDGNLITETEQVWVNTEWQNQKRVACTYDETGKCMSETELTWDGSVWNENSQSVFTYDEYGNLSTDIFSIWDSWEMMWMIISKDSTTWDEYGNKLTNLGMEWDGEAWMNMSMETCAYDVNNKIISDLFQYFDGEGWQNDFMASYLNNDIGNRIGSLEQFWDGMDWIDNYKDTLLYDENNNYISYTNYYCWDGYTWDPYSHGIFTYNESGNALSSTHQNWNMGDWKNFQRVEYYYEDGFIKADAFSWTGSVWIPADGYFGVSYIENGEKFVFFSYEPAVEVWVYYSPATVGIEELPQDENSLFTVFPNPVKDRLTVISQSPEAIIENIRLTGLTGNALPVQLTGNSLDMGALPLGIYFLSLTTRDGQSSVKKIIKQ